MSIWPSDRSLKREKKRNETKTQHYNREMLVQLPCQKADIKATVRLTLNRSMLWRARRSQFHQNA